MNNINRKVQLFSNQELVSCLKKNQFPENVVSFIEENDFTGQKLLDLSEIQIRNMKLTSRQLEKAVWECINKIKTEQLQFDDVKKVNINRKVSFSLNRNNVIAKLEHIHKVSPVPHRKYSIDLPLRFPPTSPEPDDRPTAYLEMTRPPIANKPVLMKRQEKVEKKSEVEDYLVPININPPVINDSNNRSKQENGTSQIQIRRLNKFKNLNRPLPKTPKDEEVEPVFPKKEQLDEELNEYAEIDDVEIQITKALTFPREKLKDTPTTVANSDSSDTESDKRFERFDRNKSNTYPKDSLRQINYSNRPLPPLPPRREVDRIKEDTIYENDNQDFPEYENTDTKNVAKNNNETSRETSPELPEYVNEEVNQKLTISEKRIIQEQQIIEDLPEYVNTVEESKNRYHCDQTAVPDLLNQTYGMEIDLRKNSHDKNTHLKQNHDETIKPQIKMLNLPKPPNSISEDITNKLGKQLIEQVEEDDIEYENLDYNLNNEPFYRNTDRRGSKLLLEQFEDGVFLLRPSNTFFVTLSVKVGTVKHVGINRVNGKFRFDSVDNSSPEFDSLRELLKHFQQEPLDLPNNTNIVLKPLLPTDIF